jgi:hypothetical protein
MAMTNTLALADDKRATIEFSPLEAVVDPGNRMISYPGMESIKVGGFTLPVLRTSISLEPGEHAADFAFQVLAKTEVGQVSAIAPTDLPTSESPERIESILGATASGFPGTKHVDVLGVYTRAGQRYLELVFYPAIVAGNGVVAVAEQIELSVGGRSIGRADMISQGSLPTECTYDRPDRAAAAEFGPKYLIVGAQGFLPVLSRLAEYRRACGYQAELVSIETILAGYSGRDAAEQLREYLKDYHSGGGLYVLLAGDESLLPVRYAYYYNAYAPVELDVLQICDLYFADVTGQWDVDNDGVWGERTHDEADLVPELLVGRLPCSDSLEFERYIDNLIAYETNAGGSDRSWLTRSFFYSSDEMRDYETAGQHEYIARAYPSTFGIDTTLAIEQSSGADLSPQNLDGAQLPSAMADGYGIVNVIAHGRADGYVLRSAGYNNWPKVYMLTAGQSGGHGCFDSTLETGRPGFWYSLACDNGGFDEDQAPFAGGRSMVQHLIGAADGAVGMVAYSRWGWVGSSHLLQKAFFDSLFARPDRPAVEAMYASKQALPYYRDLVLGQNYFGDPALRVYTAIPTDLIVACERTDEHLTVRVTASGAAVDNALITIVDHVGGIVRQTVTGADGRADFEGLPGNAVFTAGVVKPGHTVSVSELAPSIVTDVGDDENVTVPNVFHLQQNYPNPFNPSTRIGFSLPERAHVTLRVFNLLGQEVQTLVEADFAAGTHETVWQADSRLASGVYFYRLDAGPFSAVKKMILLQ